LFDEERNVRALVARRSTIQAFVGVAENIGTLCADTFFIVGDAWRLNARKSFLDSPGMNHDLKRLPQYRYLNSDKLSYSPVFLIPNK
jgi:hypothetical protein